VGHMCGPDPRTCAACLPIWSCSRRGLPCHRVLPPARCALTAPFHPYLTALARSPAVYFLLHFPWAHAPQALPGALPWEPGLSSTLARSDCLANSAANGGHSDLDKQGQYESRTQKDCAARYWRESEVASSYSSLRFAPVIFAVSFAACAGESSSASTRRIL
jgi:hypothetical protein